MNELSYLSEVVFADVYFVFLHCLQKSIHYASLMFVIVKLLKRFQEGLRLQLINALFKKVKALIVKHTGVKFFTVGLFLKLTDNSHILKSKQDYIGLNLLLRHFN